MDTVIRIASLIVNSEITPFMAITFFIMYNLKCQSEQNKKEIYRLQEEIKKLDEHNKQAQITKNEELKEEIKAQKEEILARAKQHNNQNAEASIKYIKELNSNLEEFLKHKDNER